jgi:hypothetical protein
MLAPFSLLWKMFSRLHTGYFLFQSGIDRISSYPWVIENIAGKFKFGRSQIRKHR